MTNSTIRTLKPQVHGQPRAVQIYPNRGNAFAWASVSLAICAASTWILLTQKYAADTYEYGIFSHSATTVPALLGIALGAGMAASLLRFVVTPTPLLALDANGLRFKLVPWKRIVVEWRDIECIWPSTWSVRSATYLVLRLDMKESVALTYGFKRDPKLSIPRWLLPMATQQLARTLSQYKEVRLVGREWDSLR